MLIIGMIATTDGDAIRKRTTLTPSGRGAVEYRDIYSAPAIEYRSLQPARIPVDVGHRGRPIGEVLYLAQRGHGLYGVADVAVDELPDAPWYLSADARGDRVDGRYHDITLGSVALVSRSATVCKTPVVAVVGGIDDAHLYFANRTHRDLLKEAADYVRARRHRRDEPHRIAPDLWAAVGLGASALSSHRGYTPATRATQPGSSGRLRMIDGELHEILYSRPYNGLISVR